MQNALIANLSRPMENHYAVSTALDIFERQTDANVRDIAKVVGLSQRRFIQVFKSEVGITPKAFSRIRRFQRTRNIIGQIEDPDWAEIAMRCGYFDQSHLIREFQEFSGTTPDAYRRQHRRFHERQMHLKTNHFPCI